MCEHVGHEDAGLAEDAAIIAVGAACRQVGVNKCVNRQVYGLSSETDGIWIKLSSSVKIGSPNRAPTETILAAHSMFLSEKTTAKGALGSRSA